jgi:hypothetical protein
MRGDVRIAGDDSRPPEIVLPVTDRRQRANPAQQRGDSSSGVGRRIAGSTATSDEAPIPVAPFVTVTTAKDPEPSPSTAEAIGRATASPASSSPPAAASSSTRFDVTPRA